MYDFCSQNGATKLRVFIDTVGAFDVSTLIHFSLKTLTLTFSRAFANRLQ